MKNSDKKNTLATLERLALQDDTKNNSIDLNSIFTAEQVRPVFQTHTIDFIEKKYGIAQLIRDILTDNNAIHPLVNSIEQRESAIAHSMFAGEIIREVKKRFSHDSTRYGKFSIQVYLSKHLINEVASIQLTGLEDPDRTSNKPRAKYFLLPKV